MSKKKKFSVVLTIVVVLLTTITVVVAADGGELPFEIVWSRMPEVEQGPDEVFELSEYGLVCVFKEGSLDCECPCGKVCGEEIETVTTEEIESSEPEPSPTPTEEPSPTPTEEPNGIWITHYDGKGNFVWRKCMPPSAVNGHQNHPGHPRQDDIGPGCYR